MQSIRTKLDDRDERGSWGLLKEQEQEQEKEQEIYKDQNRLDYTRLDWTIELREIHRVIRPTIDQDTQEYIIKCDL